MKGLGMREYTKHLVRGFGRVIDIRGGTAGYSRRWARLPSDSAAVASDWNAVWSDLGHAFQQVRQREEGP